MLTVQCYISSVRFSHSVVSDSLWPQWTAAYQPSLSINKLWSLLKFMFIESVIPSNHLILCHPLLLPPSIFPSIRVSFSESALCIRWPKYWSFNFSISPSNKYSGLISFRVDWIKPEDLSLKGFATTIFPIRTHSFLFQHFINTPGVSFHPSSQERREIPDWWGCKKLSLSAQTVLIHYLPTIGAPRAQPGPGPRKCVSFREKILAALWFEEVNNILQLTISALKPMIHLHLSVSYTIFSMSLKLRRQECFKCWAPKHHLSLSHLLLSLDEKWTTKVNNPTQWRASCPGLAKYKPRIWIWCTWKAYFELDKKMTLNREL